MKLLARKPERTYIDSEDSNENTVTILTSGVGRQFSLPAWTSLCFIFVIILLGVFLFTILSIEELPCAPGYYTFPSGACLICSAGYYGRGEPLLTASSALDFDFKNSTCDGPCDPGYYCLKGSSSPTEFICPRGRYCPSGTKSSDQFPCPLGTYGETEGLSTSSCSGFCSAVPGKYCPEGSTSAQLVDCPPGHYCPGATGAGSLQKCPQGRYGASSGLSSAECEGICAEGYFCPEGSTSASQVPCPKGYYCPPVQHNPSGSRVPCPAGTFGTGEFATTLESGCQPCPERYWCDEGTANATTLCPPGHYCLEGTTNYTQFPCSPGYYCREGSNSPEFYRCRIGYYCPLGTGPAPIPCPPGTFGNEELLETSACSGRCNAGAVCPALSTTSGPRPCPPGYFCPEGTGANADGFPNDEFRCPGGVYNNQDAMQQQLQCFCNYTDTFGLSRDCECTKGHYCPPGTTVKDRMVCPQGHFCPAMSTGPTPCNTTGYWCPQRSYIEKQQLNSVKLSLFGEFRDVILQAVDQVHTSMAPEVGSIGSLQPLPKSGKMPNFYFERGLSNVVVDMKASGVMDFDVYLCHQGSYDATYYDLRHVSYELDRKPNMTWDDIVRFAVPRGMPSFDSYAFCAEFPWAEGKAVSFSETFAVIRANEVPRLRSWVGVILFIALPILALVILQPNRKKTCTERVGEVDTFIVDRQGSIDDEIGDQSEEDKKDTLPEHPMAFAAAKVTVLIEGAQLMSIVMSRTVPHADLAIGSMSLPAFVKVICDVIGLNPLRFLGVPITLGLFLILCTVSGALYNPTHLFMTFIRSYTGRTPLRLFKRLPNIEMLGKGSEVKNDEHAEPQHKDEDGEANNTVQGDSGTSTNNTDRLKEKLIGRWNTIQTKKRKALQFVDPFFKERVLRPFVIQAMYVPILHAALGVFDCVYIRDSDGWEYEFFDEVLLGSTFFPAMNQVRLNCWSEIHYALVTVGSILYPWLLWSRIRYLVVEKPNSRPLISCIPRFEYWLVATQTTFVVLECLANHSNNAGLLAGIGFVWSLCMYFYQFTVQSILGRFSMLNNHRASGFALVFLCCCAAIGSILANPRDSVPYQDRSPDSIGGLVISIPIMYVSITILNNRRASKFSNAMKSRFYYTLKTATGEELYRMMKAIRVVLRHEDTPEYGERLLVLLGEWTHPIDKLQHNVQIRAQREQQELKSRDRLAKFENKPNLFKESTAKLDELDQDLSVGDATSKLQTSKQNEDGIVDEATATAQHRAMLEEQKKRSYSLELLKAILQEIDESFPDQGGLTGLSQFRRRKNMKGARKTRVTRFTAFSRTLGTQSWPWLRKIEKLQGTAQLVPTNVSMAPKKSSRGSRKRGSLLRQPGNFIMNQLTNKSEVDRYMKHIVSTHSAREVSPGTPSGKSIDSNSNRTGDEEKFEPQTPREPQGAKLMSSSSRRRMPSLRFWNSDSQSTNSVKKYRTEESTSKTSRNKSNRRDSSKIADWMKQMSSVKRLGSSKHRSKKVTHRPKDALQRLNTFKIPNAGNETLSATPLALHVSLRSIRQIHWVQSDIDDKFAEWISPTFQFRQHGSLLTTLTFTKNSLGLAGATSILLGVAKSSSIEKVDLSENEALHCYSISPEVLFLAFKRNQALKSVSFGRMLSIKRKKIPDQHEYDEDMREVVIDVRQYDREYNPFLKTTARLNKAQRKRQHLLRNSTPGGTDEGTSPGKAERKTERANAKPVITFDVTNGSFKQEHLPKFSLDFFESLEQLPSDVVPDLKNLPFISVLVAYFHHISSVLSFNLQEPERHLVVSKHSKGSIDIAKLRYRQLKWDIACGLLMAANEIKERARKEYHACCIGMVTTDEWKVPMEKISVDMTKVPLTDFGTHDVLLIAASIVLHTNLLEIRLPGKLIDDTGSEIIGQAICDNENIAVVCFDTTNLFVHALRGIAYHPGTTGAGLTLFGAMQGTQTEMDEGNGEDDLLLSPNQERNHNHPALFGATRPSMIRYEPNELQDGDLTIMGKLVATNTKLQEVRIYGSHITEKGIRMFIKGLGKSPNLSQIRKMVVGNWRTSCSIGFQGANHLSALFSQHQNFSQIRSLDFRNVNLGPRGCEVLSKAIAGLRLESLKLSRNNIGDSGCVAVAKLLQANSDEDSPLNQCHQTLVKLHLGSNSIGPKGIEALAIGFGQNSVLDRLYLDCNPIGDEGAYYLASALRKNSSLKVLGLERCNIAADGAVMLSGALFDEPNQGQQLDEQLWKSEPQTQTRLETLILCDNEIGDDGGTALARALQHNCILSSLSLVRTGLREPAAVLIAEAIKNNSHSKITFMDFHGCKLIGTRGLDALQSAQEHAIERAQKAIDKREKGMSARVRRLSALQAGLLKDANSSAVVFGYPEL